ncbi:WASH complex subunit 4 isoform X1 [Euwallacea fornicatus]|uniref:WASH complex subunit 4 isoform X1 n=2 Tax=Euwallacea fornicatus TaxID=995702 RepID=UPI00338D36AE
MWEATNLAEKKLNAETHKYIAEEKLHQFGEFIEEYTSTTSLNRIQTIARNDFVSNPIFTDEKATEGVSILHLTHSDNGTLSRILSTLGGMCQEIEYLKQEAEELYPSLLYYEEEVGGVRDSLESLSKIIEPLQRTLTLVKRIRDVIVLTLKQLSAILQKGYYVSNSSSSFPEILYLFADMLICLLKFDALLEDQVLRSHWMAYRRTVRNILHKKSGSEFDTNKLRSFNDILIVLENSLISGTVLKGSIDGCLESKLIIDIKKSTLNVEVYSFLNSLLCAIEKDEHRILYKDGILQLNVLVAFYINIFGNADRKFTNRLLDLNKKIPAQILIGKIVWYPEQFLLKHAQSFSKCIDEKSIENHRLSYITTRVQNLPKDTTVLCAQACLFLVDLENITRINVKALKVRQLKEIGILLTDGLKLLTKINWMVNFIMGVHLDKNLPITKTVLNCISRLIEVLKCVHMSFQRHMLFLKYVFLLMSQHLQHVALSLLDILKKNQTQAKSYKDLQLDILSSLKVCEQVLKGPNTKWRLVVANLAISASGLNAISEIRSVLQQLEIFSKFTHFVNTFCDCSVLYWHFSYVMPVYFSKLVASKSNLSKCYPLLSTVTDCATMNGKDILGEASTILREKLCGPLNQIIETNLRLQTHLHLDLPPSEPFQNYFSVNFNKLLPIPLDNVYKSIKNDTEHYMSTTFYNLTTVVLHDWRTYGEMRRLALLQYNLETVDDDLPMQTLDQGLDVLEIMRNINVFVQKYLYNLNTQIFIEETSNNKHLNSINISHVANSIRSHGIGIMNTTVNYTYQFLKIKFRIFSQFLFDEQIKSRLLKDLRHFIDHKNECHQMYPYERADKFNKGIRKLGLSNEGDSYLDLFRKVITQIGNAMGYVRLIRSGGNRCLAQGTCFIPDLTKTESLVSDSDSKSMSEMTSNSAQLLLKDLKSFTENFENTTEYFKLLVQAFIPHFRNPNNMHLKNFFIIVPPLTVNFIEHSLTCKERLFKKDKADSAFTDDGFALGLAYIIQLLDQESQLNSLHWFDSVQRKFNLDKQKVREQTVVSNSEDTKLKQTLTLTERRINTFQREFKLLEYSYSSARLFFQS